MIFLRSLFLIFLAVIAIYTTVVVLREGWGFIPAFLGDVSSLTWQGQFNLDFACYLALSALWIAWRGGFSGGAILLALVAAVAGMLFFAPLAMILLARSKGSLSRFLLGVHANA